MTTTSQQVDPLIGRLVDDRYRVRARIARGGMATVYVATDLRLERRVALKVMHGHLSDDSVFQSRFIQEARAAARLADPHVVGVFDQGQDGDVAYLVMEYLPGITLRELLREQRRLTIAQTVTIMDAVLSGLAAAHRAGFIHRDVKPENVLLAEDGRIKIGDFGLARATSANTATGQQLLGTIAYLAPELVTRGTADARSDIYALGILLYELLTGEQPYQGEQPMQIAYQHATEQVPRPSIKNPGVPEQLDELVLWSTEKAPDERPTDAGEMLERLREIERQLGVSPVATGGTGAAAEASDLTGVATDEQTRVLPGATAGMTAPLESTTQPAEPDDNAARLRRRTTTRHRRGIWLLVIALLLAAAAGGAGWWWGAGPGSLVTVPDVAGQSFDEATAALAEQELVAVQSGEHSIDVPEGQVIETQPGAGARLDREAKVTVTVSQGAQPIELGPLVGMSVDEARSVLDDNRLDVQQDDEVFSDESKKTVVGLTVAPRGGDSFDCTEGCSAHQGDAARLVVSIGALPDVNGESVADATTALKKAGLTVATERVTQYDNEVEKGDVVGIADHPEGASWRPGDTVTLIESLGPEPVPVPNVVGMTVREAVGALRERGFAPQTNLPDSILWDVFKVSSTDPQSGGEHLPGTKVTITVTG